MLCKSNWIKASAKCINVNVNVIRLLHITLIQCAQYSKDRLGVETISARLEKHQSWNALPEPQPHAVLTLWAVS